MHYVCLILHEINNILHKLSIIVATSHEKCEPNGKDFLRKVGKGVNMHYTNL